MNTQLTQFSWALSDLSLGVKWVSSKRSQQEGKGQQPLLPVMDLCEGAQLGAAETLEVLPLLPLTPLAGDVQGWLGKTRGGCGEKGSDEHRAPGVGLRQDPERQRPCTDHGGKGTLGTLPQCSVFLRESTVELRLASPLRGPNPTIFSPPVTTSSSSFLHPHSPLVLLSVNNSFWFWTSRDQQILEGGVGKTLVLVFFPLSLLNFGCLNLKKYYL